MKVVCSYLLEDREKAQPDSFEQYTAKGREATGTSSNTANSH